MAFRMTGVSGLLCLAGVMYLLLAPSHIAATLLSAHGFEKPFDMWNAVIAHDAATIAFADFAVFET